VISKVFPLRIQTVQASLKQGLFFFEGPTPNPKASLFRALFFQTPLPLFKKSPLLIILEVFFLPKAFDSGTFLPLNFDLCP